MPPLEEGRELSYGHLPQRNAPECFQNPQLSAGIILSESGSQPCHICGLMRRALTHRQAAFCGHHCHPQGPLGSPGKFLSGRLVQLPPTWAPFGTPCCCKPLALCCFAVTCLLSQQAAWLLQQQAPWCCKFAQSAHQALAEWQAVMGHGEQHKYPSGTGLAPNPHSLGRPRHSDGYGQAD